MGQWGVGGDGMRACVRVCRMRARVHECGAVAVAVKNKTNKK